MTRAQQNELIINRVTAALTDLPDVKDVIAARFTGWFQALVDTGTAAMQPVEPVNKEEAT